MSKTRSLTPAVTTALVIAVVAIGIIAIGIHSSFAKGNDPDTECLIDLQGADQETLPATFNCTDGDACDGDGATNGSCQVKVRACVNVPGQAACTAQSLKKAKVKPKKAAITVTPSGDSSACGAFTTSFVLKLRKNGTKASKPKKLNAKATGTEKGVSDTDKSKVTCQPCPTDSCVPTTTTTITPTTTSTSSTTTTLPCGNGVIDAGEACDPDAVPNGCSGGTLFCNSDCSACQTDCSEFAFTLGDPTLDCGFPGQSAGPAAPFSGQLDGDPVGACVNSLCNNGAPGTDTFGACTVDADCNACMSNLCNNGSAGTGAGACTTNADCTKLFDLGVGCLYIGGGQASIVPPGPVPNGSTTLMDVTDCSVNNVTLTPNDSPDPASCTAGPATTKHCTNGHPGTDGQGACTADNDCQPVCVSGQCVDGASGTDGQGACTQNNHCGVSSASGSASLVCLPDPKCFFGNPLPINNSGTSTCVLNVIADGVTGTADLAAGSASLTMPLNSWVYLTGADPSGVFGNGDACPICDNGVCNAGERQGQACTTNSLLKTTLDCPPPDHLFLAPLDVTLGPLTTAVVNTPSDANGIFCQGPPVQPNGGAFGVPAVRTIIQNGSAASGGFDVTDKATALASVFCIPPTNNVLIDASANLPGPGAIALGGSARLR